ncbi:hypothetical protein BDM02DRAFT_3119427 [Thelephora ganbajun]|uniref:Uncharacterized protein n=1 Tax=Thelephora ganbajun TaxID=370292 RepID=A0ACB6Z8B1_THEGA|nr:hypothetical protein BDM02DRAFT_3119427 [Thelephora ganbajun]
MTSLPSTFCNSVSKVAWCFSWMRTIGLLGHGRSLTWHYEVFRWFNQSTGKDNAN